MAQLVPSPVVSLADDLGITLKAGSLSDSSSDSSCRGIVDRMHWMCGTVKPGDAEPLPVGIRNGIEELPMAAKGGVRCHPSRGLQQFKTDCNRRASRMGRLQPAPSSTYPLSRFRVLGHFRVLCHAGRPWDTIGNGCAATVLKNQPT
jgi:hypothetical protein